MVDSCNKVVSTRLNKEYYSPEIFFSRNKRSTRISLRYLHVSYMMTIWQYHAGIIQPECSKMRWSGTNTVPLRLFFSCQVRVFQKGTWRWEIFCTDFPMTHGMLLLETIRKCQHASYLTRSVALKALRSFWSSSKIRESRMMEYILVAQSWISPQLQHSSG